MKCTVKSRSRIAKTELQVLKRVSSAIDTPRSLTCYLLAKYNEIEQLVNLSINHENYSDPHTFADDYLVTEMLKKTVAQRLDIDREAVGFEKWLSAESLCSETNDRFVLLRDGLLTPSSQRLCKILDRTRAIIEETLGPLSRSTLQKVFESMEFGPGTTTSLSAHAEKGITRGRKFANPCLTTTQQLLSFGIFCLPEVWRRNIEGFRVQEFTKLSFVPKNAKVDRPITIENDLNIFVQKGIGAVLKLKLRNIGINTENQWRVNRELVRIAWRFGLATIDLSSASDTIAYHLIGYLLPPEWFELLCWARCEKAKYRDKLYSLEKFSGMGCGFTFELETLIFHAILLACKELSGSSCPVSTFGDDMVMGCDIEEDVKMALDFCGFKVNSAKSFGKTTFHESCGADYFMGVNVRPFYLRSKDFSNEVSTFYLYANLIRRYANHRNGGYTCDRRFLPAWLVCFSELPARSRLFVPNFGYESQGLVGNLDEAAACAISGRSLSAPFGNGGLNDTQPDYVGGWYFTYYHRRSKETQRYQDGAYIGALSKMTDFTRGREAYRNSAVDHGSHTVGYTIDWCDLGPWC